MNLYRISEKTTSSVEPSDTYWRVRVLYCGYDLAEARRVYHVSEPGDYSRGHGNAARLTTFEALDPVTLTDDDPGALRTCDPQLREAGS